MVNSGTKFSWFLVSIDVSQESMGFMLFVLTPFEWRVLSEACKTADLE